MLLVRLVRIAEIFMVFLFLIKIYLCRCRTLRLMIETIHANEFHASLFLAFLAFATAWCIMSCHHNSNAVAVRAVRAQEWMHLCGGGAVLLLKEGVVILSGVEGQTR
jgi:hypothetical protein